MDENTTTGNIIVYTTTSATVKRSSDPQKQWANVTVYCFDKWGTEARITFWERDLREHFQINQVQTEDAERFKQIVIGITKAQIKKQERFGISISLNRYSQVIKKEDLPFTFIEG